MSSSSSRSRGRVLRDAHFGAADLGTVRSAAARDLVIDPALVQGAAEEGYRSGYDEGFAAGLEDASTAIESRERSRGEQLTRVLTRLTDEVDALAVRHHAVIRDVEQQIVAIAFEIATTVLGRELRTIDERGADAIRRALQLGPTGSPVIARLHPDDAASIGDVEAIAAGRALTIVVDPSLAPGDAVVDIGPTHIDARITPALERVREVLA